MVHLSWEHGATARVNGRCESDGWHVRTLLHIAVRFDWDAQVMKVLLEKCANPNLGDNNGRLPLDLACREGSLSSIYILMKRMVGDGSIRFLNRARRKRFISVQK